MGTLHDEALSCLRIALADERAEFRDGQWEAIEEIVIRRGRLLVVQRTGWGKSMVYFIATKLLRDRDRGLTLLISPLLSLMRNQIEAADRLGLRADTINSGNREDWPDVEESLAENEVDLLLVSPERLANEDFLKNVLAPIAGRIGLFVVDEAHCISDWGHDFRPDYRRIVNVVRMLPTNLPLLTTTATANDRVIHDVTTQLGQKLAVMRGTLARPTLRLQNIMLPDPASRMAWLAEVLPKLPGSGVIYTLTVRDAHRLSEWLGRFGIHAPAYEGSMQTPVRVDLERRLLENDVKALVATTALGMGFDKPDLGFVIHYQRPASLIHYYQQVGRAGRGIAEAYGVLLEGSEDNDIAEYFRRNALPPQLHVEQVLNVLEAADNGLTIKQLEAQLNLPYLQIEKVLKVLDVESPSPVTKQSGRWHRTPVSFAHDEGRARSLLEIREQELERISEYVRTDNCLMAFLQRELDDPEPMPCGCCANCAGEALLPVAPSAWTVQEALRFLKRSEIVIDFRRMWYGDALEELGFTGRIREEDRADPGRALCRWGDAGWGELIRPVKSRDGRYAEELVKGARELIRKRWRPEPEPRWVTCVPSLRHPELVPDFARRLAAALRLPFVECITKDADNDPQKTMQNSYRQSRNLLGAFRVDSARVHPRPVLLVDDMVDSRWTFTVLAAQLKRAGTGAVFPFALADTHSN